ncbi:MAG: metal-dependent transcriptional regulator [Methanoregulaceae archaeon]|jgi:Mn-dependent DtxR family transcriptional regulator|nr:metal-dependent transcriptional regulator [Methanoregulaceae archaeon]
MEDIDRLLISPRKAMYIKFIYENPDNTKTTEIAAHFRVDPSTVTKTLTELRSMGLLSHEPYRTTTLTKTGAHYAEYLVRRHRILGLVLTHYGLSPQEACQEAALFENSVSKVVIDSMCRSMGHPMMGVCGRISHDPCCCNGFEPAQEDRDLQSSIR